MHLTPGTHSPPGPSVHAHLDRHRVLDQRNEGRLGGRPAAGVALHDGHAGADRQGLLDVGQGVRELSVEAVDAHDERQARGLEVVDRRERVSQPPGVHKDHSADGALDQVIPHRAGRRC